MTDPKDPTEPTRPTEPTGPTEPTAPLEPAKPAIPSPEDDRVAVLAAYLRSNRDRFTDEALAKAAEHAGYSAAEIDAARSLAADRGEAGGPSPRRTDRGVVAAVAIAYVIGLYLVVFLLGSLTSDAATAVALIGLLGGVVGWALLRQDRPSIAQGIGCGVVLAIAIPIVAIVVIIGICVAKGSYPGGR